MNTRSILQNLANIETMIVGNKMNRIRRNWFQYVKLYGFYSLYFKVTGSSLIRNRIIFTGQKMALALPSGGDIYLHGIKPHSSEIRLAKYLISTLHSQRIFFDIGAHFGYFSLLASHLIGSKDQVFSFEPSPKSFSILHKNLDTSVTVVNKAISETSGTVTFFEFPTKYLEYNTSDDSQYKDQEWYLDNKPTKHIVECITLASFIQEHQKYPTHIKIDVEGGELSVLKGMGSFLQSIRPTIIMEYITANYNTNTYNETVDYMIENGYAVSLINHDGSLSRVTNVKNLEQIIGSDNIVFTPLDDIAI